MTELEESNLQSAYSRIAEAKSILREAAKLIRSIDSPAAEALGESIAVASKELGFGVDIRFWFACRGCLKR